MAISRQAYYKRQHSEIRQIARDAKVRTPYPAAAGPSLGPRDPVLLTYYQAIHERHGLICSMTDGYNCYQHAMAERINGILKSEFLLQRRADLQQAARQGPTVGADLQPRTAAPGPEIQNAR